MKKILLCLLLVGCQSQQVRMTGYADQCSSSGFERGSQAYLGCMVTMENSHNEKVGRITHILQNSRNRQSTYRPADHNLQFGNHKPLGNMIRCRSNTVGDTTYTNCDEF